MKVSYEDMQPIPSGNLTKELMKSELEDASDDENGNENRNELQSITEATMTTHCVITVASVILCSWFRFSLPFSSSEASSNSLGSRYDIGKYLTLKIIQKM